METPATEPRWHLFRKYGLEVSDQGEARSFYGETLVPYTVGGDMRVHVSYEGYSKSFSLKRVVAEAFVPRPFVGNSGLIDFKNGDFTDCRAENLYWKRREQKKRSSSGDIGVSFNKESKRWKAYVVVNREVIHLGYFDTKEEAASMVDEANRKLAEGVSVEHIRARRRVASRAPRQQAAG